MAQITRANIKRIIQEVAQGASEAAGKHKKALGGIGAAGAAGAAGYAGADEMYELAKKGLGAGRRMLRVGDSVGESDGNNQQYRNYY